MYGDAESCVKLTPPQTRAIEHAGRNLQLIACAGSGKTEVAARRVVPLLTPGRADSISARNIVAFTFTDKAAAELKERIVTRTRQALGELPDMAEMFVGTIHTYCLELFTIDRAWTSANLGLARGTLRAAIRGAAAAKAALTDPEQKRWGQYSIQRVFLSFLDDAGVREERVPNGRGEVVFYDLGKFRRRITDFETIRYHSKPIDKYASFADFRQYRAEDAYPEGWQDNQYANPDAIRIMTAHQAKGMQWPVVFMPVLLRNRFPAAGIGGRNDWHVLPRNGIKGQSRFEGTFEDERRLF